MTDSWIRKKRTNIVLSLVYILIISMLCAVFFDFYFDLNDDVLMKDIMSGAYAGTPSGYNIQMLYPISVVISWFYKVMPDLSWYGIFLCGCQFLCFFLMAERSLENSKGIQKINRIKADVVRKDIVKKDIVKKHIIEKDIIVKGSLLVLQGCLVWSLFLAELIYVQYTATSALLAGTAVFLFYTTPIKWTDKCREDRCQEITQKEIILTFWKKNSISVLLLVLAFQIRTEMLLLVLPFVGVAGICKWSEEKDHLTGKCTMFTKQNIVKYTGIIGAIGIGLLLSLGINKLAYGDAQWKTFYRFFDARTSVYDFYGIPKYEENKQFYDSIGMEEAQYQLLENYNFGLDDTLNADTLEKIAEYAKEQYNKERIFLIQMKTALRESIKRVVDTRDAPWNICVVAAYILVLVLAFINEQKKFLWQIPLLLMTRTSLWFYILYRERTPDRITHSLYLVEIVLLFSFLFVESKRTYHKRIPTIIGIVLCMCAIVYLPSTWRNVERKQEERELINQDYLALRSYCMENKENYYLLDVYSTVDFSEKMFTNIDNSMKNYDIMGGWASKSPIHTEALALYGIENIEKDLLEHKNLYMISETDHMDGWMEAYYATKGIAVKVPVVERITNTIKKDLRVYQVIPIEEP